MSSFLILSSLVLAACGGDDGTAPTPQDPSVVGTVTATGGTVQTNDGKVSLTFPAGAVTAGTTIKVTPVAAPVADSNLTAGTAYEFGPSGIQFAQPVDLSLRFDPTRLPGGREYRAARVSKLVNGAWMPVAGTPMVDAAGRVTAKISSFSSYAVTVDPCWPQAVDPISSGSFQTGTASWAASDCVYYPNAADSTQKSYEDYYQVRLTQAGGLWLKATAAGVPVGVGLTDVPTGPGAGTVLGFRRATGGTQFKTLLPPGSYRIFVSREDGQPTGSYAYELGFGPADNDRGCEGVRFVPPMTLDQSISAATDCVVKIQFPAKGSEWALGREVVEEYFVFKGFAGRSYTISVAKTGGDAGFSPYPTVFLGGGQVIQPENPSQNSNVVTFTSATTRYYTLGVSGGLDQSRYFQGTYRLSVQAN